MFKYNFILYCLLYPKKYFKPNFTTDGKKRFFKGVTSN